MNINKPSNDFNEVVKGRRSVKVYDPKVKISREEMEEIIMEATLAPSSVNMQPWRFLIIDSPEAKAKLAPLARFNQEQVETSAAVIAIFGDLKADENVDHIYEQMVAHGYMPQDVKDMQLGKIKAYYDNMPHQVNLETALIDAGLVTMQLMLVARAHGYETNPIGGYEKDQIADVFGIDKERHAPVMLLSIGKGTKEGYPSYRLPFEKIAQFR
ncbi:nitroreductase family protein [Priestia koreensis]|uniref:NAD(P)H nitroreductase n=1 Tax=Priestia koreensis TaxID=284581 RepID=A0A0M0KX67_9BACI|nr:nitroreductase family protein [Priestia koreensis]KOO42963.1 NAD(P)H nitroreductase [Priestia koreensis]